MKKSMNKPDQRTKNFCKEPVTAEDLYCKTSSSSDQITSQKLHILQESQLCRHSLTLEKNLTTTEAKI